MIDEYFDIETLANYLQLTPEQVRKMANRGRLPGRRVGGDWRFARVEIHHWLERKIGVSDQDELIRVERVLDHEQTQYRATEEINIPNLLSLERISIPLGAKTKNSVIEKICEFSAQSGALWSPKDMAEAVRRREELHPTALENGVALLHPRRTQPGYFGEPFLSLGITSSGIPFGGPKGLMTDVFFLIASTDESFHLRVLARLSRLIQINGLLENLRSTGDSSEAWQLIADADTLI